MTQTLEYVSSMAGIGIGLALVTVVGQCMGANRPDQARMYIKRMTFYGEIAVIISGILLVCAGGPHHKAGRYGAGECCALL